MGRAIRGLVSPLGGLVVVCALLLVPRTAGAQEEPAELPDISCEVRPTRSAILLACRTSSLEPSSTLRLEVSQPEGEGRLQGAAPATGGTVEAVVTLPCSSRGTFDIEASARAADGTRLTHRQPLSVDEGCLGRWDLSGQQWTRLALLVSVPVLAVVVLVLLRRRRRSRRRRSRRRRRR